MENNKQTAVEYLEFRYKYNINLMDYDFKRAKEMEKHDIIDFVDWLTKYDSPYAIMFGNDPEKFSTEDEDFTIEQVYEEYLKQKEIK